MNKDRISQNCKDWVPYPYKGHVLSNPQYIKDKNKTFKENGNGWWCNDGKGWSMHYETSMEYHKRKRKERNNG